MKKIMGLLFILSSSIFARELTLEDAIQMALNNSKEMKISEMELKKANINVGIAFKEALPSVVYKGTYTRSQYDRRITVEDRPKYRLYPSYKSDTIDEKGGFSQKLVVSQPLFQGGAIIGGIKYARANKKIANLQYLASKRDTRLEVIKIYSDIVKGEKDLKVLENSKKELDITYEKQKEKLKLRLTTKADLLKTEYSVLDLESQIVRAKNIIIIEKEKLKLKLGISKLEELDVTPFEVPMYLVNRIDFQSDLNQALTKSIDAMIASEGIKAAKATKMVAMSAMLPQVNAFASYGVENDRRKFNATMDDAELRGGIQVSWNVFQFGKDVDNFREASVSTKQQELKGEITKDNIDINLKSAYLELVRIEETRAAKDRAMQAAEENFEIDRQKYAAGLISTIDFLNSETQSRRAKVEYNQVVIDYLYAFEKYRSLLI